MDQNYAPPAYGDWQQQQQPQQYGVQHYPQHYPQQYPQQQPYMTQPQQQQYPPQPVQQQQPQVVTQVIVTGNVRFHHDPVAMTCPHCQNVITTTTHTRIGPAPWLICVGLILLGFWLGCCIIPFFVKPLKDVEHKCPNCKKMVGRYNVM